MQFFLSSDVKDNTNFTIGLQIDLSSIIKNKFKHSLIRLLKFIDHSRFHIIL